VARSTNRGESWLQTATAPADTVFGLAIDPLDANRVFVATPGGVYHTSDGGTGWTRVCAERGLRAVAFYPGAPDTILAGGDNGVWISRDRGQNWQAMSEGLAGQSVTCLAFTATDAVRLYAGTARGAAYVHSFSTGAEEAAGERQAAGRRGPPTIARGVLFLGAVPDPARPGKPGTCLSPVLLDVTGRQVMELQPGENSIRHLSPGVYFVLMQGPGAGETAHRVVVTR
jgi:hypothetical protein